MNNRLSRLVCWLVAIVFIFNLASDGVSAGNWLESRERNTKALLEVEDLQKITNPAPDEIVAREESVVEEEGIKTIVEDIYTKNHRIIITHSEYGSSVFVEDFATGMGYEMVGDSITEIYDLNEIRADVFGSKTH